MEVLDCGQYHGNDMGDDEKMRPYMCPVCDGKGIVPNGFYLAVGPYWATTSTVPDTCQSCNGTGVVWGAEG